MVKERILRANLYIGFAVIILSAFLLILETPFMKTWFYCFAWWSFILIVDSINFRRKKYSLISISLKDFLFMAFISVFVWLLFELFNLRLRNWSYHGLPEDFPVRWLGYFIAFATVIPAMKELQLFFLSILKKNRLALFRLKPKSWLLVLFVCVGILSSILVLIWPRIFFPLVWLCFIFLLEPINFWLKNDSLLKDFERRDWRKFWSWILAGLLTGLLWEFWNFWAGSHWEYSLPYFNFGKMFQMPVLGYTGFLPFALQIFAIHQFLYFMRKKIEESSLLKILIFLCLLWFYFGAFYLIDMFSLSTF